jgi:hypothetical protein
VKYSAITIGIVISYVAVIYILHEHLSQTLLAPTKVINEIKACASSNSDVNKQSECMVEICNPLQEDQRTDCYAKAQSEMKGSGK